MARPEEKAQNMMNKWVKMREGEGIEPRQQRRPHLASLCEHLHDAEKWRRQIVREISDGIMKIQNPGQIWKIILYSNPDFKGLFKDFLNAKKLYLKII